MATAETIEMISINQLIPSKSNPRKTFPEDSLQDLARSIEKFGVLQPILVQALPDINAFEIIAGERRYRASQLAGMKHVPARIVKVSPLELLEMQVIENLQREDVHPLEEAEGYEALMRASSKSISVEDIAARVGKSKAYVYQRMQLCKLQPACRDAYYEGRMGASVALLLARIPVAAMQVEALEELLEDTPEGEAITLSEARWHIQSGYMTKLANAPFDTNSTTLVPEAGSCLNCEKRTGAEPELFAEIASSDDICTDITCFRKKKDEHRIVFISDMRNKGFTVLEGADAKKVCKPYGGFKDYIDAESLCYNAPRVKDEEGDEVSPDYDQLLTGSGIKPIYVEADQWGTVRFVKLYPESEAETYLKEAGMLSEHCNMLINANEHEQREKRVKDEAAYRRQLFINTHAAIINAQHDRERELEDRADANSRMIANALLTFVDNDDARSLLRKAWTWDKTLDISEQIRSLLIADVGVLMVELAVIRETRYMWDGSPPATQLIDLANRYGVETNKAKVLRAIAPKKAKRVKQKEAA